MVLEELVAGHFDGVLDPAEEKELARQLQASAEARELMASYLRLEGLVLSLGKAGLLARRPSAPRRKILWAIAAAAVLLVAALYVFRGASEDPSVARLEHVEGDVRANGTRALAGQALVAGQELETR